MPCYGLEKKAVKGNDDKYASIKLLLTYKKL